MLKIWTWFWKKRCEWYFRKADQKPLRFLMKSIKQHEPGIADWKVYYWTIKFGASGKKLVKALGPKNAQKIAEEWHAKHQND